MRAPSAELLNSEHLVEDLSWEVSRTSGEPQEHQNAAARSERDSHGVTTFSEVAKSCSGWA